jgi:protoheme IX farnesyltransferase
MKPAVVAPITAVTAVAPALALPRSRVADFVELTKPRIGVMVLFTVAAGALLARPGAVDAILLMNALVGVGLVASAASALNQLLERHTDARMRRTENRPLPAGRLLPVEVLGFGVVLAVLGLAYLAATMRHPLPVAVTAFTLVSYVLIYTPLKRYTTLNTLIGAVPGALPPVIGWTAVTGTLDREAVALFLILFLWQVPHFLAIAWMYREDYGRAGLQMLPAVDADGAMTARQMVSYCLALVPVSLMPALFQQAGWFYALGAVLLGLFFTRATLDFWRERDRAMARRVLHASLVYLPALLALLLLETWMRLWLI